MSVKRPGLDKLEAISDYYGFDLSSDELRDFQSAVAGSMAIYDRLDELADESLPVKYPRADMCRVPDDRIAHRSYPLLAARELLQPFIREQVHGHQAT